MSRIVTLSLLLLSGALNAQDLEAYSSAVTTNSKGVEFTLEHPAEWISLKPDRPNVVAKFFNQENTVGLVVLIKKLPGVPDKEQLAMIRQLMGSEEGLSSMPGRHQFISGSSKTLVDNLPASTLRYKTLNQSLDQEIYVQGLTYTVFYKDNFITLMFHAMGKASQDADSYFVANKDAFERVARSFIVISQWKSQ